MLPFVNNKKRNLTPDNVSYEYKGDKTEDKVIIRYVVYSENSYNEKTVENYEECFPFQQNGVINWLSIIGLHNELLVENVSKKLGLHPLLIEDILQSRHLPKIEYYDDYVFLIVKILEYNKKEKELKTNHVSIVFSENYLVSFMESESEIFSSFKEKLKSRKTRATRLAADYLNYSLIDSVVDKYEDIIQKTREDIERLEDQILEQIPNKNLLREIQKLKNVLLHIRRYVVPLKEVIRNMEIDDSSLTKDSTDPYLKDLYDHILQVIDSTEIQRERLLEITTNYLTVISNRMNEVMKVLTIISTIFIPLTFITSVYGMNFKFMPELAYSWAYPAVLILMAFIATGMVFFFKHKKWF